jgi:hypothetical protein
MVSSTVEVVPAASLELAVPVVVMGVSPTDRVAERECRDEDKNEPERIGAQARHGSALHALTPVTV